MNEREEARKRAQTHIERTDRKKLGKAKELNVIGSEKARRRKESMHQQ